MTVPRCAWLRKSPTHLAKPLQSIGQTETDRTDQEI
jgi:hypothetical protein